jgi:hypothetical protein
VASSKVIVTSASFSIAAGGAVSTVKGTVRPHTTCGATGLTPRDIDPALDGAGKSHPRMSASAGCVIH